MTKQKRLLIQFAQYMVGGGVYFWSGYATFALAYSIIGWGWFYSKMTADIVGWTLNFLIQRYWAFANPKLKGQDKTVRVKYIFLTVLNFVIDYAIVGSLKHFGVTPYIGLFVAAVFFTGWNWYWYKYWVFKPRVIEK